jgi:hypothetical protein
MQNEQQQCFVEKTFNPVLAFSNVNHTIDGQLLPTTRLAYYDKDKISSSWYLSIFSIW